MGLRNSHIALFPSFVFCQLYLSSCNEIAMRLFLFKTMVESRESCKSLPNVFDRSMRERKNLCSSTVRNIVWPLPVAVQ